jgi:hypothetical protein
MTRMKRDEKALREKVLTAVGRMDRIKLEKLRIFIAGMEAEKRPETSRKMEYRGNRIVV